jgi:pimeloyl-ACP methyl ester carboxylesterase
MYVSIGGIEQWIQVGGDTPGHPILLYLHGGPGGTSVPASAAWRAWEDHFTVAHWDQRGAGRTFARNGATGCGPLSLDLMVRDGIEVAEYLIERLHKPTVLLVGHSWGSALGVHMVKRRPELFCAFVGTGQLVNMRLNEEFNYRRYLQRAERTGNSQALEALRALGPPPFSDWSALKTLREWSDRLAEGDADCVQLRPKPLAPDFKMEEVPTLKQGAEFSSQQLYEDLKVIDLPLLGPQFALPMFCFHGACDQQTPVELAEEYFAGIVAPHKEFVSFAGCHHFVVFNRPDLFLGELLARVRPLIQTSR